MPDFNKNEIFTDHPYNDYEKILEKRDDPKKGYNTIAKLADSEPAPEDDVEVLQEKVKNLKKLLMNDYLLSQVTYLEPTDKAADIEPVVYSDIYSAEDDIFVPEGPKKSGFGFKNWDKDSDTIKTAIQNGEKNIEVNPVYDAKLTVKYEGIDHEDDIFEATEKGVKLYHYIEPLNVEGYKVAGYRLEDGTPLSTLEGCSFYALDGATIIAKYVKESDQVERVPIVAMNGAIARQTSNLNRVSFLVSLHVPDDYSVTEFGCIRNTTGEYAKNWRKKLVLSAENVKKGTSSLTGNVSLYISNIKISNDSLKDLVMYVRGYAILTDPEGNTKEIYSDNMLVASYNSVFER